MSLSNKLNSNCYKIKLLNNKINNLEVNTDDTFRDISNVIIVAANGGAEFTTITSALQEAENRNPSETNKISIFVSNGTYTENIILPEYVDLIGAGIGSILTPEDLSLPAVIITNNSSISGFNIIV